MNGPLLPPTLGAAIGVAGEPAVPTGVNTGCVGGAGTGVGSLGVGRAPEFLRRLGANESTSPSSNRRKLRARRHCAVS